MTSEKIFRFAPSPTGFLHIGGARTALFNWLLARQCGGKMLLRIEDTDRARSSKEAIEAIQDGLRWLGLDWDEDIVFQHSRSERHREVANSLLSQGLAYRCYASPEELDNMRTEAMAAGKPPRYDGRWRDRDPSEAPAGVAPVIRLKAPQSGQTQINDKVQGLVTFPNADLDDLILLRSDGSPTYMLAVVVDDYDMGVTDIVRGVDHLTNAARQKLIIDALGWPQPELAHIPLIHGSDGAKLSKRHGALGVESYRAMGYLPDALRNYLVRLGWSHGDQELFSDKEMIDVFSLDQVGKSAARFDFSKLEHLNALYLRERLSEHLEQELYAAWPYLEGESVPPCPVDPILRNRLSQLMDGLKERAKTLVELTTNAAFLFMTSPLPFSEKAEALLDDKARLMIDTLYQKLQNCDWQAESLDATVRFFATEQGMKLGAVAQPLRAALTGQTQSPGIFDVMLALGREESLKRLEAVSSPQK